MRLPRVYVHTDFPLWSYGIYEGLFRTKAVFSNDLWSWDKDFRRIKVNLRFKTVSVQVWW